jgi:hypothetical protein
MQTRQSIISSLQFCSAAESDRIATRLQTCNVRIVRHIDATTLCHELSSDLRTRHQVIALMESDTTVAHVEYNFGGKWTRCDNA